MAASVNKAILIGNLGRDPEVRNTQSGSKVVNLTIATSETWNDRASGEKRERTEWHRVVIFNEHLGDVVTRYLSKGRKVFIEGELRTRKWTDQQGVEKYTTEIVLAQYRGNIVFLDGQGNVQGNTQQSQSTQSNQTRQYQSGSSMSDAAGYDDEIPF